MKYGRKTNAMLGVLFHRRHQQLGETATGLAYRRMTLDAADRYLATDPSMADRPWPVELGIVAFLEFAAYELTGSRQYLDRARHSVELGVATYWEGGSPLPKADPACAHYENITRADTLALAALKLYVVDNSLTDTIGISDIDR